jgi:8-oxo-dGTP pyrophosphatase MutT (NUDIX family)
LTVRGGPQVIPRPPANRPGRPAPWSSLDDAHRTLDLHRLRAVFDGRRGAPSTVEGAAEVLPSAVLAAFWEHEGALEVLLTRRAGHLRTHRGEVAFPGGRCDPGESPTTAVLREAQEEVGLDPSSVTIVGELDHLMTVSSRSFIVPFVATLAERPRDLVANPAEVDTVLFVPVAELLLDEVYREEVWTWAAPPPWVHDGTVERSIFFFELVGDTVWGATAAMLRQLLGLALGVPTTIDHH